jgi:hypothetical protein
MRAKELLDCAMGRRLSAHLVPQQGFALAVMAPVYARRLSVLLPVGPTEMRQ